ncbi:hypothetical protein [Agrobacterium tumefaciens]|uniref:hypothetical protein n=1 Tax=Agrobacterium tumefaciens TaxID=358 RepID=UPI003B9FB7D1
MSQSQCFESHVDRIAHEMPSLVQHPGFDALVGLMATIEDNEQIDFSTANRIFLALMDAYAVGRQSKKLA